MHSIQVVDGYRLGSTHPAPAVETLDFHAAHFAGMAHRIGVDMPANPVHVRLFGTQAVVLHPQPAPNFVEQARPAIARMRVVYGGSHAVILHMDVSMPDNAINVSLPHAWRHARKSRFPVRNARLTE